MPDISLLPENLRGKEERERTSKPAPAPEQAVLKMHVPTSTADEDIEIIEVDESELSIILAEEPLLTRLTYQVSAAIDALKGKLSKKEEAPPPKTPPQFFTPPKPGLITKAAGPAPSVPPGAKPVPAANGILLSKLQSGAPGARPKARITPAAEVPKRVRVIKRVRKQVRVSLIPAEELALLSIDVGRRQWTLAVLTLVFATIIGGGYVFLRSRVGDVNATLAGLNRDVEATRTLTKQSQQQWAAYQDLQPRLALLNDLLNNHVVITRVFEFLESTTRPDVSYRSASISPTGALTLDVVSLSFGSAARQLVAFERSPMVKKVDATAFSAELDGTTGQVKQVSFQLILSLDASPLRGPILAQADRVSTATSTSP
ncbi:hypothetical protein A3E39_04765 [Candidatus Uhrbacteria bacterium RIFCSPHIGHO2_12_FULL_60_25]|uniref:PilN domain-containing protein n=1 Tax=Candidatus Uhrbacteria bacterium RIFCSPHIGHO2_12_FULL_60_25 TaxID=1802399 RepID=A0A1F7UNB5_9BACT|nr:MAG: hypothetical protein A3D73_01180 [Candidatus Uhrbacteria bacterium RIFCSPHIGHO2_02_FULL_60_44]OGL79187.1 MAG: hypothetical protein A3E39_04765 [Candidatus Uhrbacteria bacterium RIFCSPHIGHO2_12_FULL_60_25]